MNAEQLNEYSQAIADRLARLDERITSLEREYDENRDELAKLNKGDNDVPFVSASPAMVSPRYVSLMVGRTGGPTQLYPVNAFPDDLNNIDGDLDNAINGDLVYAGRFSPFRPGTTANSLYLVFRTDVKNQNGALTWKYVARPIAIESNVRVLYHEELIVENRNIRVLPTEYPIGEPEADIFAQPGYLSVRPTVFYYFRGLVLPFFAWLVVGAEISGTWYYLDGFFEVEICQ